MGYDTDYFVAGDGRRCVVAEGLQCPVCHGVFDNPMVLDPCGHSFCKACIVSLLESGHENCPVCRTQMIEGANVGVPPNRALKDLIFGMTVRCMNCPATDDDDDSGTDCCPWTGPLADFQGHSERDCPMHVVECPIPGCDFRGPRSLLGQHNANSIAVHTDLLVSTKLKEIKEELLGAMAIQGTSGSGGGGGSSSSDNSRIQELQRRLDEKDQELHALKARLLDQFFSDFFRDWILAKPPYFQDFVVYRPIKYLTGSISQIIVGVPGPGRSDWQGGLYPLLITLTPEGLERKEPPKCDFPESFFHPNVYEGNVRVNTLLEFEGSFCRWDPSISLHEILFCIQQLLTHPNRRGSTLYDPIEYRESVLRQAQKYNLTGTDFLERAMVELQSKFDAEYKKPLEPWENERWENLEEVRWKGKRSFQARCEPRGRHMHDTAIVPVASSEEVEARFLSANRSSDTLSVTSGNDENHHDGAVDDGTPPPDNALAAPVGRSILAPITNANSSELSSPPRLSNDRIRNDDGDICDCSCCQQGSRSFIDRNHRMRYLFGEGG